jgi:hypothetical protein
MRAVLVILLLFALGAVAARTEQRTFIIDSDADGYGIDRCLSGGAACGAAAARAYCRARDFAEAVSYRKVSRDDITGAVPASRRTCRSEECDSFVAIACRR